MRRSGNICQAEASRCLQASHCLRSAYIFEIGLASLVTRTTSDAGTLAVRESLFEGKFQSPKTRKAHLTIPLGPNTIAALESHRQRSTRTSPEDLVFATRTGKPMRESKILTEVLQPAAIEAGLGRVTRHQFRHIHSTLLNHLKVPVKIAQEQLGHPTRRRKFRQEQE